LTDTPYTVQQYQDVEPATAGFSLPLTFLSQMDVAPGWEFADRDAYLRSFWKKFGNDMLQAVLAVSIAKIQTQNWELEGPEELATAYHRILRDEANFHKGYGDMIARGVVDYYTQDNGWFIERQRSGPDDHDGPMLGIAHLDSNRMKPTGNAEHPYMYMDEYGAYHLMHRSQFIRIVDMPTPETSLHSADKGFCALSRALSTSIILMLLVTMKREKLADLPPSAMAIFNNINRKQFEQATQLYGAQEDMKGNMVWRQLMPLFGIDPAHPASIQFISLREVWEGYDDEAAMNMAAYSFAAAWRIDPREFRPVSQGPLGTGKEAEVQHQKAKAKSTGLLFTEIERAFNADLTMPVGMHFKYVLQDADEEEQRAGIHSLQIGNIKGMQDAGAGLQPAEVRFLLTSQYKVLPQSLARVPAEGEVLDLATADVYMDDVDRQTKEYNGFYFGPVIRIDSNGHREYASSRGLALPPGVKFFGEKGGSGSGNYGHAGRPGLVGGSGGEGGVPSGGAEPNWAYDIRKGRDRYTILKVPGGAELAEDEISDLQKVEDGIVRVTYNTETRNWHIADASVYEVDHADFLEDALEDKEPLFTEAIQVRGAYDAQKNELLLYDFSEEAEYIATINDLRPMAAQAVPQILERAARSARHNLFRVHGEPPKVEIVPFSKMAGGKEFKGLGVAQPDQWSKKVVDKEIDFREFASCDHAVDLFPIIIQQLQDDGHISLEQACKANLATPDLATNVSDAARRAILQGQDIVAAATKELVTQLSIHDYHLGDKEAQALQTIKQKISSLPSATASTVRSNARRLGEVMAESRKRRASMLEGIPDDVWNKAVARDESREVQQSMVPSMSGNLVGLV